MGGGSKTVAQQTPQVPPQVMDYISRAFGQMSGALDIAPLTGFVTPNVEPVVGPNQATLDALNFYQTLAGGGATPGVLDAFNRLQAPLIEQSAMQAGLGRSGALPAALATGQAAALMPALQLQQQAAGSEAAIGDYLRQVSQAQASAPYQDFLRRQGIAEELIGGATGTLPSTVGQVQKQNTTGAGVLGWLLGGNVGTPGVGK